MKLSDAQLNLLVVLFVLVLIRHIFVTFTIGQKEKVNEPKVHDRSDLNSDKEIEFSYFSFA